jgi:hypothetical protein
LWNEADLLLSSVVGEGVVVEAMIVLICIADVFTEVYVPELVSGRCSDMVIVSGPVVVDATAVVTCSVALSAADVLVPVEEVVAVSVAAMDALDEFVEF